MSCRYYMELLEPAKEWGLSHAPLPEDCRGMRVDLEPPRTGHAGGQGTILLGNLDAGGESRVRIAVKMGPAAMDAAGSFDGVEQQLRNEFDQLRKVADTGVAPLPLAFGEVVQEDLETGARYRHSAFAEEYLAGETLSDAIDGKRLTSGASASNREIAALGAALAGILERLDRAGVSHRDCNPRNILVRRGKDGWIVKMVDFGLATDQYAHITMSDHLLFSLPYASPEKVDRHADFAGALSGVRRGDKQISVDVYAVSQNVLCMRLVHSVFPSVGDFERNVTGAVNPGMKRGRDAYRTSRSTRARLSTYLKAGETRPGDRALAVIIKACTAYEPESRPVPAVLKRMFEALSRWCELERREEVVAECELTSYIEDLVFLESSEIPPMPDFRRTDAGEVRGTAAADGLLAESPSGIITAGCRISTASVPDEALVIPELLGLSHTCAAIARAMLGAELSPLSAKAEFHLGGYSEVPRLELTQCRWELRVPREAFVSWPSASHTIYDARALAIDAPLDWLTLAYIRDALGEQRLGGSAEPAAIICPPCASDSKRAMLLERFSTESGSPLHLIETDDHLFRRDAACILNAAVDASPLEVPREGPFKLSRIDWVGFEQGALFLSKSTTARPGVEREIEHRLKQERVPRADAPSIRRLQAEETYDVLVENAEQARKLSEFLTGKQHELFISGEQVRAAFGIA